MFRTKLLSFLGWAALSIWSRTIRMEYVNKSVFDRLAKDGKNFIYAFWHSRLFLLFHTHRNADATILASESRDGEIAVGILKRFGFDVVVGSSKRKGDRALLNLVGDLRRGKDIAIAVDGPRGPGYEVKQGVTYLAGKLNKPIVPLVTSAKRYWILGKTWDKFLLPAPFTRGVVLYGEPFMVQGTSAEELETKRKELERTLNKLMADADNYFKPRYVR